MLKIAIIALSLLFPSSLVLADNSVIFADQPQAPAYINAKLITEITEKGQKINAIALQYEDNLLSAKMSPTAYQVTVTLDGKHYGDRKISNIYTMDKAELSSVARAGSFLIIELNKYDENADLYSLRTENSNPVQFRYKTEQQKIGTREMVQSNRVPEFYAERLHYTVTQQNLLKLANGKTLDRHTVTVSAASENVINPLIDRFTSGQIHLKHKQNTLNYRFYKPEVVSDKKYPLTIFLHGSGQLGQDNIAQLLSSKGAITTLQYEQGFVLAPQYNSVFDPFDNAGKGQKGGIHWQTENRRALLLAMIDNTLKVHPEIDTDRIYLVGLSRGAEGALYLLLDRPDFFAGALLMSGREAWTIEWIDGNASKANMAVLKNTPIWFFHSKEDKVSPVAGSRINYKILSQELNNPYVKYTEFSFNQPGDNGILNSNPHNSWDVVFNSPQINHWLLSQRRVH